jgi:hypothetical protein
MKFNQSSHATFKMRSVRTSNHSMQKCKKNKMYEKRFTEGSVKTSSCRFAVETRRLLLSSFRASAVISWPFLSINFCITCKSCVQSHRVRINDYTQKNQSSSLASNDSLLSSLQYLEVHIKGLSKLVRISKKA